MEKDFARYPKYRNAYIMAFEKMIANHPRVIRVLDEYVSPSDGAAFYNGGCARNNQKSGSTGSGYAKNYGELQMQWWLETVTK